MSHAMSPDDCPHPAMKVEPGWRICSACGLRMKAYDSPAEAMAAMRAMVVGGRKPKAPKLAKVVPIAPEPDEESA